MKVFYFVLVLTCFIQTLAALSIARLNEEQKITNLNESEVDRLALQQTEAIKKIISDRQQIQLEYTENSKNESINNQQNITINLEELRLKCKHLESILRANNSKFDDKRSDAEFVTYPTNKFATQAYPVYFRSKKDKIKVTTPTKAYYITKPSANATASTTQTPTKEDESNVKYIKLEPVILQKTFLTNGKVVYYWHRSLPTAMHYANPDLEREKITVPATTQRATTTSSSIYSFKNFFPFHIGGNADSYATTTESATSTTTSTTTPKYSDFEDLSTQLKFVVPVPYMNSENVSRDPWSFDQFAYYPMPMQPNRVNIRVPYVPTFHVIKALAVPNKYLSSENANKNANEEKFYSDYRNSGMA